MDRISTPLPPPPHPLSSTHERQCSQLEGKFQEKHKKASVYLPRTIILNFACKISNFTNFSWVSSTKESIFFIHRKFLSHLKEIPPLSLLFFLFCFCFTDFYLSPTKKTCLLSFPTIFAALRLLFFSRGNHISFGLYQTPTKRHAKLLLFFPEGVIVKESTQACLKRPQKSRTSSLLCAYFKNTSEK